MRVWLQRIAALCVLVAAVMSSGCITARNRDDDSDIPWNTPQPWEGSVMPGYFNQY